MDTSETDRTIAELLEKAEKDRDFTLKEKLKILLADRKIPYIPITTKIESLCPLGNGVFGVVELINYQKKLYAHKRARQKTREQRNSILDEGIKLSDINQRHPNIQRLNFINLHTNGIVIDYCSNGSLDAFVRGTNLDYTLVNVLHWGYQLADALSFLHSNNIIHRDVKMQNILLKDNYQTLVLTDYGTATQLGKSWMTDNVGTPITMAPEVFAYNQYAEQCDTYSWSIVFWQLITKQLLPYGNNGKGFLISVVRDKLRPDRINHCPELFLALMYRAWHSDPNERPKLSFIKKVLRLILNELPQSKQNYTDEMANDIQYRWLHTYKLLKKYLPHKPRPDDQKSINLYEEHLAAMERIIKIQQDLSELQERKGKIDDYEQVLNANQQLEETINELRSKIVDAKGK
ncbi:unnamed protein product [Rotaria socialis]|uniref:Protein kinase domain-containing protein n=1 Tax=Rotaria socialis TaxID=392032 RepID=A0A820BVH0_9BILA|nr:unnamed protein product [Rotaria socialis]CAF3763434.1 unnamed protein product [Rotaria socialis]CAF4204362.1 unnamed protein product [Rotaria socialis]CAF4517500.1 unnamed protein product [Rotaria socialis]